MRAARVEAGTKPVQMVAAIGLVAGAFAFGCGAAPPRAVTPRAEWVLVTVESVRIADTGRWDPGAESEGDQGATGEAIGALLGLASETLGTVFAALSVLASSSGGAAETRAEDPDPFLRVTLDEGAARTERESHVVRDSLRPDWRYATYVWTGSLRESGIELAVLDRDGDHPERVGALRLTRAQLESIAHNGEHTIDATDGGLEGMHVRIEPAAPSATTHREVRLALRDGFISTGLTVPAGAPITITVTGGGRITNGGLGSCSDEHLTPAGLHGGACRRHNLRAFPDAPHGAPVALIGRGARLQAVDLSAGATATRACVTFVSSGAGPIVVGINDDDLGNDAGEYVFDVTVGVPAGEPGDDAAVPVQREVARAD